MYRVVLLDKTTLGHRAHVYAGEQEAKSSNEVRNNDSQLQGSSQKRKNRDSKDDEKGERDERHEPNGKRRKLFGSESQKCKVRFPCIFYAGEPDRYPSHTKRYEFIAQLL
jgi:hypothetical protein